MDTVIRCENLSKNYKGVKALQNLSLEIKENLIVGFLGVNGAGKTTTIKLLNNLIKPTAGEATICDTPVFNNPMKVKSMVGYLSQEPAFYKWMTGREFLMFVGEVFRIEKSRLKEKARKLLAEMELSDAANKRIGGYSTGMKQRLGIAQSLINDPKVLFLDEPLSSLDPLGRVSVMNIIKRLKGKTTVFMSSHILTDIERVCDEVAIIDKGKLIIHDKLSVLKEKYISPAIRVECKEPLGDFREFLMKEDYVFAADREDTGGTEDTSLKIIFSDFSKGEIMLPKLIVESNLTLVKYDTLTPTLEDVFLKLIDDNNTQREA
ncbi:ABC transporter ATP-binding protein [Acidobacteriota bacterium]